MGTHGNVNTIDLAFHKLGFVLLLGGIGGIIYFRFCKYLINPNPESSPLSSIPSKISFQKIDWIFIGFLVLFAFLLRFSSLGHSFWADEISVYRLFIEPGFLPNFLPKNKPKEWLVLR